MWPCPHTFESRREGVFHGEVPRSRSLERDFYVLCFPSQPPAQGAGLRTFPGDEGALSVTAGQWQSWDPNSQIPVTMH